MHVCTVTASKKKYHRINAIYSHAQSLKTSLLIRKDQTTTPNKQKEGNSHPQRQGWQTGPWTECGVEPG